MTSRPTVDSSRNPWTLIRRRSIYDNPWIRVREDDVIRPDGSPGIYGVVEMKSWAIGIVPLTPGGETFLVGQYRYTLNQYSWEIPEGGGPLTVSPLESARRELREETGLTAARWTYLGEVHTSNSATNETGCVFLAEELEHGEPEPDGTEELAVWRLPLEQAFQMAMTGEISDSLAVIGIARAVEFLRSGRRLEPIERSFPGLGRRPVRDGR